MGGVVIIGCLIINSDDMLEGSSESTGALAIGGSGCGALDDLPRPEVLAFLVGGRHTKLSGREVVAPSVVGSLLVSYLR